LGSAKSDEKHTSDDHDTHKAVDALELSSNHSVLVASGACIGPCTQCGLALGTAGARATTHSRAHCLLGQSEANEGDYAMSNINQSSCL